MTPKERYLALLSGETPDFVPRIPILMQFAAEYIGSNYGAFARDHRVLVEANLRCAEDFGFDQVSCISDPYRETAGLGGDVRFRENATPECVAPPLPDLEKVGEVEIPDPDSSPRMRDRLDAIRLYRRQSVDHFSILGWVEGPAALAGDVHGLMDFLMDLIEEPDASEVLLDLCTETSIRFALAQIEAGADTIGIGDAICSQMSGETYQDLIWPRQKRLIEAIHNAGAAVRMHICGQTKHLWPGLSQLPIDILDCDHMIDMPAAREAFPDVILAGNHDPVADVLHGTPESIRTLTLQCRQAAGARFMVNAGCEIPSGTPPANLKALCEPLPCG
ncbi:uroporphyrinogen decarboxylase family protein [Haloferula sp. A504]|uniref:uroporphyrinogen decarboxylase family protein n=1 Tax=Haloferula sp. A504 TaxID=3373601 RepID=UPI0031CA3E37|nr:uroporphyrinogen decarboxylase family protein [Verrucomicrobiaceae bacterium E54]